MTEPGDQALRAQVTAAVRIAAQPVDPLVPRPFPVDPDPSPGMPGWSVAVVIALWLVGISIIVAELVAVRP